MVYENASNHTHSLYTRLLHSKLSNNFSPSVLCKTCRKDYWTELWTTLLMVPYTVNPRSRQLEASNFELDWALSIYIWSYDFQINNEKRSAGMNQHANVYGPLPGKVSMIKDVHECTIILLVCACLRERSGCTQMPEFQNSKCSFGNLEFWNFEGWWRLQSGSVHKPNFNKNGWSAN